MRDGGVAKLSSAVLKMKFMSRTRDKEEKRDQAEQAEALFASQLPENLKGNKFFMETSYVPLENLKVGLFSYKNANPELEQILRARSGLAAPGPNADIKEDVTKKEMASFQETLGNKFRRRDDHVGSLQRQPATHSIIRGETGAGTGGWRKENTGRGGPWVPRGGGQSNFPTRGSDNNQRCNWAPRGERGGWNPRGGERGGWNSRGGGGERGGWNSRGGGGGERGGWNSRGGGGGDRGGGGERGGWNSRGGERGGWNPRGQDRGQRRGGGGGRFNRGRGGFRQPGYD